MKITHFMLTVSAVIAVWLVASYLRPIPSDSYEQASASYAEESTVSLTEEPEVLVSGAEPVNPALQ